VHATRRRRRMDLAQNTSRWVRRCNTSVGRENYKPKCVVSFAVARCMRKLHCQFAGFAASDSRWASARRRSGQSRSGSIGGLSISCLLFRPEVDEHRGRLSAWPSRRPWTLGDPLFWSRASVQSVFVGLIGPSNRRIARHCTIDETRGNDVVAIDVQVGHCRPRQQRPHARVWS